MKTRIYFILVAVILGLIPFTASSQEVAPCIDLVKKGPYTASPGETITFTFQVTNCGNTYLGGNANVYDPLLNNDGTTAIWSEGMNSGDVVTFSRDYSIPKDYSKCTLENDAWAIGIPWIPDQNLAPVNDNDQSTDWTVFIKGIDCSGTGTPGYWKNHPDAWPSDPISIGGTSYSKGVAIDIMKKPVKGDKTYTMFDALVSAKLNVIMGNPSSCIDATITAADAWMALHHVKSGVKASSSDWKAGEPLYMKLDSYNNGLLCAPHRD
jgi:uncharacterized repeat protein (TIGR01451 family)